MQFLAIAGDSKAQPSPTVSLRNWLDNMDCAITPDVTADPQCATLLKDINACQLETLEQIAEPLDGAACWGRARGWM